MTYVIAQPCVDLKDRACVDECPVDCIYEGKRMLYIHPDECVDCGACEPVCPVEAIFYEDDTPEEWKGYYDANVHFFDDLGSPGRRRQARRDRPRPRARRGAAAARTRRVTRRRVSAAAARTSPGTTSPPHAERARAAPRRHRRPVDRHARRPDPGSRAPRARATPPTVPGYPLTIGRVETRQAALDWLAAPARGHRARPRRACIPSIGSKELIASLPTHLGRRPRRPGRATRAGLPDVRGRRRRSPAPAPWPPTR